MSKQNKLQISEQSKAEAMKIAKATQRPNQTKEQTKLIAQGIQKGIAEYKKQQKSRKRDLDRRAKQLNNKNNSVENNNETEIAEPAAQTKTNLLPWLLLAISWIGFIIYITL